MRGPIKLAPVGLGWRIGSGNQRHDDFRASPYTGCRFPPEIISHSVWLYFRFRLRLRMVEEMLAARGIRCLFETETYCKCSSRELSRTRKTSER
jgi:putative transposase